MNKKNAAVIIGAGLPVIFDYGKNINNHEVVRITNSMPSPSDITQYNLFMPQRKAPTPRDISSYIAPVQLARFRQDFQNWREGILEAEQAWYPHRVKMQRLFIDTVLNAHVEFCMNKRRRLTLLRKHKYVDMAGNEIEAVTQLFKKPWFTDFLSYRLDAKAYGYSLIQIGDIVNGYPSNCTITRRWNISPDRFNVTQFVYSISGLPFNDPTYTVDGGKPFDWVVWCPTPSENGVSPCGYGYLYKIGILEIALRNLFGFNNDFLEVFGQPFRWGKTNKKQEEPEFALFEQMLSRMGANGYAITDPTDEIEFLEGKQAHGANDPYDNMEQRCEKKISKVILGHADAGDSTPGKLGGDQGGEDNPVAKALREIQQEDGTDCELTVNEILIPKLRKLGIMIPLGRWELDNSAELLITREKEDKNNLATAQVVQQLNSAGFNVDETYISERTGIPITKKEEPDPAEAGFSAGVRNKLLEIYA